MNKPSKYNIAVIGATGKVGATILDILAERNFPVGNVYALASQRSIGKEVSFGDTKVLKVDVIDHFDFAKADIALFSAGSAVSKQYAPIALAKGCSVIDNTSYFRMDKNISLVVPEINADKVKDLQKPVIIANPNCVAIPVAMVLKQLSTLSKIKKVIISTYQSVSGAGMEAMRELHDHTKDVYIFKKNAPKKFQKPIAFNLIPCIDTLEENHFTGEENKIRNELMKILDDNSMEIITTCVRTPVFISHCASVTVEFADDVSRETSIKTIAKGKGLKVTDAEDKGAYCTPVEAAGQDLVFVSRVRNSPTSNKDLSFWVATDNIRKGAALNAVQIAEILAERK